MMSAFWVVNGRLVIDSSGAPIHCDVCPCVESGSGSGTPPPESIENPCCDTPIPATLPVRVSAGIDGNTVDLFGEIVYGTIVDPITSVSKPGWSGTIVMPTSAGNFNLNMKMWYDGETHKWWFGGPDLVDYGGTIDSTCAGIGATYTCDPFYYEVSTWMFYFAHAPQVGGFTFFVNEP